MLTSLSLANFKPFSTPQRIDIAPLTLLVGPNGSGKSSILHAILYLHELVTRGEADVHRATFAGSVVELGGFARLVHRHEDHRAIVLRAEFTTPRSLERAGHDLGRFPFPDLDDEVGSAWLELTVRRRITPAFRGAVVDRVVIGVNGSPEPLVWLETGASLAEGEPILARVNLGHPLLAPIGHEIADAWCALAIPEPTLPASRPRDVDELDDDTAYDTIARTHLGLPEDRPLPVFALASTGRGALPPPGSTLYVLPQGDTLDPGDPHDATDITDITDITDAAAHQVRTFLEMVVLGTTAQLAAALRSALHVGPLRSAPPRGLLDDRPHGAIRGSEGLGAWERLLDGRAELVARTNAWLDRLGTGDRVVVQQLFDPTASAEALSVRHIDRTARRLLVETPAGARVLPCEAGASLSQVLPVVVAALDARLGLVEQPEAYVHPDYHHRLGDLLVAMALRDGGRPTMLVETHSDALVQRVLAWAHAASDEAPAEATALSPHQLAVLYVEPGPEGVRVRRLPIDEPHGDDVTHDSLDRSLDHEPHGDARPPRPFSPPWTPAPAHP